MLQLQKLAFILIALLLGSVSFADGLHPAPPEPAPPVDSPAPAPAPAPTPAQMLQGEWVTVHPMIGRGLQLHLRFNFNVTAMIITGTCVFLNDGMHMSVSVKSAVGYNRNDLYIYDRTNGQVSDGYRYCQVSTQPSTWQFYFNALGNAVLIATVPYQAQFELTRPQNGGHQHP